MEGGKPGMPGTWRWPQALVGRRGGEHPLRGTLSRQRTSGWRWGYRRVRCKSTVLASPEPAPRGWLPSRTHSLGWRFRSQPQNCKRGYYWNTKTSTDSTHKGKMLFLSTILVGRNVTFVSITWQAHYILSSHWNEMSSWSQKKKKQLLKRKRPQSREQSAAKRNSPKPGTYSPRSSTHQTKYRKRLWASQY